MQSVTPLVVLGGLHLEVITDVAWSPDGRHLAVSSYDCYCRCVYLCSLHFQAKPLNDNPEAFVPKPSNEPSFLSVQSKQIGTRTGDQSVLTEDYLEGSLGVDSATHIWALKLPAISFQDHQGLR